MTFDDDEAGKIFVGGLNWQTTQENLESYFRQYGEIVDSVVMKHNETGKSRGFGFITYKDSDVVSIVLSSGPHVLDGKTIDPKACTKRSEKRQERGGSPDSLKAFLGGLPLDITEDVITQAFQKYGEVKEVVIMYDQEKQKPRGFGFLTFDSQDALQRACREHFIDINGKQVECKAAQPRNARPRQPRQQFGGSPRQGGGGGGMSQPPNWQYPGGPPQAGGYPGGNSAPGGGYSSGYSYPQQQQQQQQQQPPAYDYQQGSYGSSGGYQGYNAPASGYSAYSTPAQPAAAPQYGQYGGGYGSDSYQQSDTQYGPAKGRQSGGDNGYGSAQGYKSEAYGSHAAGGQGYHPYK